MDDSCLEWKRNPNNLSETERSIKNENSAVGVNADESLRNVRIKSNFYKTPIFLDENTTSVKGGIMVEEISNASSAQTSCNTTPKTSSMQHEYESYLINNVNRSLIIQDKTNDMTDQSGNDELPPHAYMNENGLADTTINNLRRRFNTTSTIHAAHTIMNPNNEQLLFCMASVIQAQICEDVDSIPEYLSNPNPNNIALQMIANDFNMIPDLPVAFGGVVTSLDVTILDQEASEDEVLRNHIIDGSVPTIDTIYRYMSLIYRNGRYTPECHIIGLVFINRITAVHHLPLTMLNWRSLWLVAIILAQKVWDDRPLRTSTFSKIIPSFSKQHLRKLEANALHLLQYLTNVKPSLYAKYYFELRDLFTEIMGFQQSEWGVKPLNMAQGKQLESRFDLCSNYYNGIVLGKSNGDKMLMPKKSHANQASNVSKDVVVHNALDGKIRLSNMNDGVHSVEDSTDANMTSHNNIANGYIERRVEENELISNLFDCLDNSGDEVEMESFSEISPSSVSSNAVANTNKDSVPIDNTVTVTDCYNRLSVTTTNTVADGVHMIPIPNPTYMSMLSLNEKLRAKHADDMEKSDAADADWSDDEEDDSGYKFRLNTMKNTLNKVIENNNVSDNNSTNLNTADTHTGATAKPSSETANMIPTSSYPNPMSTASDKNLQQHSNVGSKNTVMYSNASRVTTPSVTPLRTPGPLSQSQTLEDYHYQRTPKASYHVLRF